MALILDEESVRFQPLVEATRKEIEGFFRGGEVGEELGDALLNAGILRLRPVLITVGATVFALVPLALHGGPLWEPLCYAQIGGLAMATVITLLLVPVFYSIAVLGLKLIKWAPGHH
ncbi:MAG TPA: efflux RND transporter permease subunit [Gemmatimonadales bacterium]|nr:efflux RND transporter permease subunit [Gemmatimonadales bacterium]